MVDSILINPDVCTVLLELDVFTGRHNEGSITGNMEVHADALEVDLWVIFILHKYAGKQLPFPCEVGVFPRRKMYVAHSRVRSKNHFAAGTSLCRHA